MTTYQGSGGPNYMVKGILALLAVGGLAYGVSTFSSYLNITESAAPAVSSAGQARIYADSTSHTLKLSTNGGAYSDVGAVTYKNTADSTALAGDNEEDTIFSTNHSIPANTLRAGSIIRVHAVGVHTSASGSVTNIALKLGSVEIASTGTHTPSTGHPFFFNYEIIVRTIGASGTVVAQGYRIHGSASGTGTARPTILDSTTVDTTGALTVGVWIDRAASVADSDSTVIRTISVEVIY